MLSLRQCHSLSSREGFRSRGAPAVQRKAVRRILRVEGIPSNASAFTLRQARPLLSPTSLTISYAAVDKLLHSHPPLQPVVPVRTASIPRQRVVRAHYTTTPSGTATASYTTPYSSIQVVLTYEIDGVLVPDRDSLVDLRMYPNRRAVRINNHRAYDLLEGKVLTGWKKDDEGRLVAVLKSCDSPGSLTTSTLPAPDPVAACESSTPSSVGLVPVFSPSATSSSASASGSLMGQATRDKSGFIFHMQHSVQQQLASSSAAAAAVLSAVGAASAAAVKSVNSTLESTLHRGFVTQERQRTYVPARVRPVMNEVYVPFGMWRDLFDGSERPFPTEGMPLRVMITGAVHMSEQPALLVRRITPYGYYVLRGVRGLNRLKGKLMVRWSLLMNGVVEMEVSDRLPAAALLHPLNSHALATADAR